jgi:hypothetical protein
MSSTNTQARIAGLLYLATAIGGGFSELFIRARIHVPGDAAATAAGIVAHATLFRVGVITDLLDFVCFLGVGIVLYTLLKPVNPTVALAMLVVNAVSVAMSALNMLNQLGALLVATDPRYTSGWSAQATHSLVLLLVDMQHQGYLMAQVFFGLFLLPLGYLVYKSGLFPRVLGAILMVGCGGYLAGVAATYASPALESNLALTMGVIGGLAELSFVLWLLFMGARTMAEQSPSHRPATRGELSWKA